MSIKDTPSQTELPQPGEPLLLSPEALGNIREISLNRGLFYVVPPSKRELHAGRPTRTVTVGAELETVFGHYKDPETNTVIIDTEDVHREIISGTDLGLTNERVDAIRLGINEWFKLAFQFAQKPEGFTWLAENLAPEDFDRLELNHKITESPVEGGSLVRVDLLRLQSGKLVSCDPNLLPLGMAHNFTFTSEAQRETGTQILQSDRYVQELATLAENHPGLTGYLTSLNYGNWSSHMCMALAVTETTGRPFHIIPTHCLTESGMVDTDQLREFYKVMGLEGKISLPHVGLVTPSCVIRYARETVRFDSRTKVINCPGSRVVESQIWGALAVLPGIDTWMASNGIQINQKAISEVIAPSILARLANGDLEIATSVIHSNGTGELRLKWETAQEHIGVFEAAMSAIGSKEKAGERAWYVKSPSTSGKKGVRYTNDGSVAKAPTLVERLMKDSSRDGIFIIQPKIRSVHPVDGAERRLKVNLFLTGKNLDFSGADCMLAPINQRAAHGGSQTVTCLIKV